MKDASRRLADLEAKVPAPPSQYDLHILSDDELIALAMLDAGKPVPDGQEIDAIYGKLEAHRHG